MIFSMFLARILGPYFIIIGIGILLNRKNYQQLIEDFFKNTALVYLGGIMSLFFGLLIVLLHNVWTKDWFVLITVFGWLGILKGVWLIVFPGSTVKITRVYKEKSGLLLFHSLLILALGGFLAVKGYAGN